MYFDIVLRYQLLGKISGPVRLLLWPPSPFLLFSVQRLHGFRQVVHHVWCVLQIGIN